MVRIQLLGPVQIESEGEVVRDLRSQKALGLLGYLCLQNQPVTRPYLVEMFWPAMTEKRGRRNLSWALSQLSRHLPDCFEGTRQTVQFVGHQDVWLDVQAFGEQVNQRELASAADLYQAELMAGLYLDDCPEFETWLVGEREVWRQRMMQLLSRLVKEEEVVGRYPIAIDYTRRLLTLEPWHEEGHRQLMQLLAYNGQAALALAHYEVCCSTLADELGVEPDLETTALQDGVYWVVLETVRSWAELLTAVAQTLRLSADSPDVTQLQNQMTGYLHDKKVLLVLDNFEHLLAFNTRLLEWLHQIPQLKLLLTSRSRLNVQSEWSVTLEGLDVPEMAAEKQVEAFEATRHFLRRMRQVQAEPLTEEERQAVIKICRLVEGLPLAIELAAAWTRLLPPSQIWQELEQSFDWLMTEMADMPGRHRNLNAVVAYSWNVLTAEEQAALSKLAVFSGGFRREAARVVAGTSLQTLARLSDQLLIRQTAVPGRFDMHTVVRHYAAGQLAQRPSAQREARLTHLDHYQAFLRDRQTALQGERQQLALEEIMEELDNVRAAWEQAVQERGTAVATQFFTDSMQAVFHVYDMQSRFREGATLFAQAAGSLLNGSPGETAAEAAAIVRHKLLARQGWFLFHVGQLGKAQQLLQASLDYLQAATELVDTLFPRNYLAAVLHHLNRSEEAAALAEESLNTAADLGDRYAQAIAGNILA